MNTTTRRAFLKNATSLSVGIAGLSSVDLMALGTTGQKQTTITFDLHCHPGVFFAKGVEGWFPGDEMARNTIDDMFTGGLTGAFFALVSDGPLLKRTEKGIAIGGKFEKGEAWAEYKRQLNLYNQLIAQYEVNHCSTTDDLRSSIKAKKVGSFLACEGGDFIESTELLEQAYSDGVRSVQVVHYVPNHLGDLQTESSMHDGLSTMGREVVKKMNQLGMVIDVAHASHKTVKDVVDLTEAPLMLSHSILQLEPDRPIARRAISEDHAKAVASTGGVIGAWPSGFSKDFDEYVDNIMRLVDVVGLDHVSLGTDMDANYKPVLNSYKQLGQLSKALADKGLASSEVNQIMGENANRVLKAVLG